MQAQEIDTRLEIGGNNPPGALELADTLMAEVEAWSTSRPEIADDEEAKAAQGLVEKLRASKKGLATAQSLELEPHEQAVAAVKTRYRGVVDRLEASLKAMLAKSGAWLVKERDRIAAEKAAKEAEARRAREEADRLERERLEAARKLEEERRRQAEERERADREELEAKNETERAAEAERLEVDRVAENDAADRAAAAAVTAKAAEREAAKKPVLAAIKSAPAVRAMTLRTYWSAAIEDEEAALESYRTHPTVRKATLAAALQVANEAARTSKDMAAAPPGFRFIKEERAS